MWPLRCSSWSSEWSLTYPSPCTLIDTYEWAQHDSAEGNSWFGLFQLIIVGYYMSYYCPLWNVFLCKKILKHICFPPLAKHVLLLSHNITSSDRFPQWRIKDHKIWHIWVLFKSVVCYMQGMARAPLQTVINKHNCFEECFANPPTFVNNSHLSFVCMHGKVSIVIGLKCN